MLYHTTNASSHVTNSEALEPKPPGPGVHAYLKIHTTSCSLDALLQALKSLTIKLGILENGYV